MQKLIFTNKSGTEIDLTSGAFGITFWEGLSNTELNVQTQRVPFNDGAVFLDALMEQREITVTVAIEDGGDLEKRYELKRQLISALNPKLGEGVLVYRNDFLAKQIKAVPQLPIFENKNSNDAGTLKATVTFSCPSPYWEDLEEIEVELTGSNIIENNGDVPVQVEITIPSNSNEFAIINQRNRKQLSLQENSQNPIIIDTNVGKKSVKTKVNDFVWHSGGMLNRAFGVNGELVIVGSIMLTKDYYGEFNYIDFNVPNVLYGITYGNGLFVAVGFNGTIVTSSDRINWVNRSLSATTTLLCVTYGNGLFVAGGSGGRIYTSSDGANWTQQTSTANESYIDVMFKQGLFVAVGQSGKIYTSSNGANWNPQTVPNATSLSGITYGNGLFIVVGNVIFKSSDLINWTKISFDTDYMGFKAVTYSEKLGLFVAVGGNSVVGGDSDGIIYTSSDGETWTQQTVELNQPLNSVIYFNGLFIAVGQGGAIVTSSDGETWTVTNGKDFSIGFKGVAYGNGLIVGAGNDIFSSSDGINWTKRVTGALSHFDRVRYLNNLFVACGSGIRTSVDGITWRTASVAGSEGIYDVAYGNGLFVAINDGAFVFTSTNGTSWTRRDIGIYGAQGITYGNGLFVAVGANQGVTMTSPDGINWTQNTIGDPITLLKVTYNDGLFVAVGTSTNATKGVIYISANGVNWNKQNYEMDGTYFLDILISNGLWVIVGAYGKIVTSTDGANWTDNSFSTYDNFNGIAYGNDLFYVVGDNGELISNSELKEKNLISKLSPKSDMSFNLEIGENNILYLNEQNKNATLKYRQKYIGV